MKIRSRRLLDRAMLKICAGLFCAMGCQSRTPAPPVPPAEEAPVAAAPAVLPGPAPASTLDARIADVLAGKAEMGLPRPFDGYAVEDVTAGPGTLVFHTRLSTPRAPGLDTLRTQAMLAPVLAPRVCAEPPSRAILDAGGLYAYRFVDVAGVYVTTVFVTRADCARAAGR